MAGPRMAGGIEGVVYWRGEESDDPDDDDWLVNGEGSR